MADLVQQRMEQMLPELRDLEEQGIFTAEELQQIQKTRSRFEYAATGRAATMADFQEYVKHELAVEQLRRTRKERLALKNHSLSSFSVVRRIHNIYQRALTRFPHEKHLFIEYVKFAAQSGAASAFNRILMRAIRHHPREAIFWRIAAERQLKLGHLDAARSLVFRGLRAKVLDPVALWLAMLNVELTVLRKLPDHITAVSVLIEKAAEALAANPDAQLNFLVTVFKSLAAQGVDAAQVTATRCLTDLKGEAFVHNLQAEQTKDSDLFTED